jgi:hypothetical protein
VRWRPLPAFAAIDFLSCLLVVFVAVALTSSKPEIQTLGSYAVVMTWPAGNNDVDLYVRDPSNQIAYFDDMQVGEMQLEHDDLGTRGTTYGKGKPNEERTIIRSASPGQWVVDTHLYRRGQSAGPIPVVVSLWDLQGQDRVLEHRTVYLTRQGDERTPFSFTVDARGNVTGYSFTPISLISSTTNFAAGS